MGIRQVGQDLGSDLESRHAEGLPSLDMRRGVHWRGFAKGLRGWPHQSANRDSLWDLKLVTNLGESPGLIITRASNCSCGLVLNDHISKSQRPAGP